MHADSLHPHAHSSESRLLFAVALTIVAMLAEAAGGWWSGSLALLADAGHMLVDTFALLLAWAGAHFARRPADARRSFGYARLEVLVGYTNALAQLVLVAWIVVEGVLRLAAPVSILSGWMLVIATGGLAVNLLVLAVLGQHDHDDINVAGARLHVLGDLLGSLGAVIAAGLIGVFGWLWADPVASIVVALLILRSAWKLLHRSAHILLEGTPEGVESAQVADVVRREAGVADVHHVHIWLLAGGSRIATLHAHAAAGSDPNAAIASIQRVLRERFNCAHTTVQMENPTSTVAACDADEHRH